ncbi:molybdate ABC transporter substrate-binding protein [Daeguia caeni]|uniref:Molybdate ABC transporter substrate-binding protein n=1 Tax=Daeguia caeni TaxID=439612 RepID=A0ABV9H3Z6_9HYPH
MKRLLSALAVLALTATMATAAEKVTVFAAASMKDVIDEAARQFSAKDGTQIVASYAASSALAKQIEAGAPAQIFISADLDWMSYLARRKLIDPASRQIIAGNALIIATDQAMADSDARTLLDARRFAMGDPSNVPAGKYGKAALETLGLWGEVKKNAVFTENVRLALQYVVLGEVKAAIVYASDRMAAPELKEAYRFPASSHAPILYPAALIEKNASDQARAFLAFLTGPAGQAIITARGFMGAAEAKS